MADSGFPTPTQMDVSIERVDGGAHLDGLGQFARSKLILYCHNLVLPKGGALRRCGVEAFRVGG
jgi:hypothetical protein